MFLAVPGRLDAVTEDWERAADAVEREMTRRRIDRAELARMTGLDRKTIDNFLDRHMKPRTSSRGKYEDAFEWTYGSLADVARGRTLAPTPRTVGGSAEDAGYVARKGPDVGTMSDTELDELITHAMTERLRRRESGESMDGAT